MNARQWLCIEPGAHLLFYPPYMIWVSVHTLSRRGHLLVGLVDLLFGFRLQD